jgi:GT2 family glycosyltransferase
VFEATLGPAIEALNAERLRRPRRSAEIVLGTPPEAPRVSLVVTLYGRVDFMDLQLGLFSAAPDAAVEIVYVLDDPRRAMEAEQLARSCHARYGLPFRLILLEENQGFAVANNVGAAAARGRHVCLMNSDVFPLAQQGMGFLAALAERLEAEPGLGAVGPLLLYEDGTVQHAGMTYERVNGLPDWFFPMHPGKGRPPGRVSRRALAITGACVMLRRADWQALGGFDEGYVIGDFEDSDLCLRLRERGLGCGVEAGWALFHLERQSQEAEAAWRFNTTLFNAWRHDRRWGGSALLEGEGA